MRITPLLSLPPLTAAPLPASSPGMAVPPKERIENADHSSQDASLLLWFALIAGGAVAVSVVANQIIRKFYSIENPTYRERLFRNQKPEAAEPPSEKPRDF